MQAVQGVEEIVRPAAGGAQEEGQALPIHRSVMVSEVLQSLGANEPGAADERGWFVDATLGAGGHARAILEAFPRARLLGLDQDPHILRLAARALDPFASRARVRRARASELARALDEEGVERVRGVLLDLGASSPQLDDAARGFSFSADGPLDMRMDPDRERTAADILNTWDESDLADLFFYEGDETRSRRVARAIVEARRRTPWRRTLALAELVERALGGRAAGIHPATKVFQALRRAVNEEGEELRAALAHARDWLVDDGVLSVLSFHSGEDRAVKRFLAEGARGGEWKLAERRPLRPSAEEVRANRRSRSALLRSARRARFRRGGERSER